MSNPNKLDDSKLELLAMSVPQFCKMVGIGKNLYYAHLKKGEVPAGFMLGKRRLIPMEEAKAWVRQQSASYS